MNEFLEILKYTLPAFVVFLTSFFILKKIYQNEEKKRRVELSMNTKDTVLPLRLQAYERLILLLERISPESVVMRHNRQNVTVSLLQNELITAVRTEFEHNLVQQTYISSQSWEMIKNARNNVIKLINDAASELKPDLNGMNLSKRILEKAMELETQPSAVAIEYLKREVRELF